MCILGRKMRFLSLNSRLFLFLGVLLLSLSFSFANKVDDEESCRVYAGGQVYPQERRTSEHALHWSKAQSNLKRILLFYVSFSKNDQGSLHREVFVFALFLLVITK